MQIKEELEEEAEKIKKKFDSIERIVITGAAGYLGSYLTEEALEKNYLVTAGVHKDASQDKRKYII